MKGLIIFVVSSVTIYTIMELFLDYYDVHYPFRGLVVGIIGFGVGMLLHNIIKDRKEE